MVVGSVTPSVPNVHNPGINREEQKKISSSGEAGCNAIAVTAIVSVALFVAFFASTVLCGLFGPIVLVGFLALFDFLSLLAAILAVVLYCDECKHRKYAMQTQIRNYGTFNLI